MTVRQFTSTNKKKTRIILKGIYRILKLYYEINKISFFKVIVYYTFVTF